MTWLAILIAAALIAAVPLLLGVPRASWMVLAATALFALAGYAWQGRADLSGQPGRGSSVPAIDATKLIELRRQFFPGVTGPSRSVALADGFTRRGRFDEAAGFLDNALSTNPNDIEAWVALGLVLIAQAGGQITPAADYAFAQAQTRFPEHPGPPFFIGLNRLQSGDLQGARDDLATSLSLAPKDAAYRDTLTRQIASLDRAIEATASSGGNRGP